MNETPTVKALLREYLETPELAPSDPVVARAIRDGFERSLLLLRIAELEAALDGLYQHTRNNYQICGLNEVARAALAGKEATNDAPQ